MKKILLSLFFLFSITILADNTDQQKAFTQLSAELNNINQQLQQIYIVQQKQMESLPTKNFLVVRVVPRDTSPLSNDIAKGMAVRVLGFKDNLVETGIGENTEYLSREEFSKVVWNAILQQLQQLQQTYKNNRYIIIKSFSVNLSIPPSVSVNLEFR